MPRSWIPEGYNRVAPYLVVPDAEREIVFLKSVFDAETLRRYDHPDGSLLHGELRIGDSVIMMGQGNERWPAIAVHLHVYVPDVDAAYQKALAAGAESVQEPKQQEGDPDRRGGVRSPGGNTWWIATLR